MTKIKKLSYTIFKNKILETIEKCHTENQAFQITKKENIEVVMISKKEYEKMKLLNNTPRKSLDYKTPNEVWDEKFKKNNNN